MTGEKASNLGGAHTTWGRTQSWSNMVVALDTTLSIVKLYRSPAPCPLTAVPFPLRSPARHIIWPNWASVALLLLEAQWTSYVYRPTALGYLTKRAGLARQRETVRPEELWTDLPLKYSLLLLRLLTGPYHHQQMQRSLDAQQYSSSHQCDHHIT